MGLLDRVKGEPPAAEWIATQFEGLGYASWAYRVVSAAGAAYQHAGPLL